MRALVLLCGLFVLGCPETQVPVLTALEAFTQIERGACDRAVRCGEYTSADECVAGAQVLGSSTRVVSAIEAGSLAYDVEAARSCLEALATGACESPMPSEGDCDKVFTGLVPSGGGCPLGLLSVCVDSTACQSRTADLQCQVVCVPLKKEGESIADGGECDDHLLAQDGVCVREGEEGADCTLLACAPHLYCDAGSRQCSAKKTASSGCLDSAECQWPLRCLESSCQSARTVGAPCRNPEYCTADLLCRIAASATEGTCQPLGRVGEDCVADYECRPELGCSVSQKCAQRVADGADCSDSPCLRPSHCGVVSRKCQPDKARLEACANNDECGVELLCLDSTCKSLNDLACE